MCKVTSLDQYTGVDYVCSPDPLRPLVYLRNPPQKDREGVLGYDKIQYQDMKILVELI